jgi:hypothetical protein
MDYQNYSFVIRHGYDGVQGTARPTNYGSARTE